MTALVPIMELPVSWQRKTIRRVSGCWEWCGAAASDGGYGCVQYKGRVRPAHKAVYDLLVGEVPVGLEIDHLCRNKRCINPAHLEPVTKAENARRRKTKTHCLRGHPFDEENTRYRSGGGRSCKACESARKTKQRRLAGAA